MGRVRRRHCTVAPVERLFDLVCRADRIPEWDPLFAGVRDASGPLDHAGARFEGAVRIAGVSVPMAVEVTRVEPPSVLVLSGTAPGGGRMRLTRTFARAESAAGVGGSEIETELDYRLPFGLAGEIADHLLVAALVDGDVEAGLENLASIAEAIERVDASTGVHPELDRVRTGGADPAGTETLP